MMRQAHCAEVQQLACARLPTASSAEVMEPPVLKAPALPLASGLQKTSADPSPEEVALAWQQLETEMVPVSLPSAARLRLPNLQNLALFWAVRLLCCAETELAQLPTWQ